MPVRVKRQKIRRYYKLNQVNSGIILEMPDFTGIFFRTDVKEYKGANFNTNKSFLLVLFKDSDCRVCIWC